MPTIAAIATPPGTGGVGIIRLSGPDSLHILNNAVKPENGNFSGFRPRFLHHGWIKDKRGEKIDECLAVYMPGPGTFTGEDVAEIHCHGSPLIVQLVLELCLDLGARQAERGEFSRRAFLNGRLDLSQAEAVAELVAAQGRDALRYSLDRLSGCLGNRISSLQDKLKDLSVQACVAVDFPDDELPALPEEEFIRRLDSIISDLDELLINAERAKKIQADYRILILGPVNAGKSSLLNAFSGRKRALVSEYPGTTRDFLEENLNFNGLSVCIVDSAGLRETIDPVESLGIDQSLNLVGDADLIWLVLDGNQDNTGFENILSKICGKPCVVVLNKNDLPMRENLSFASEKLPVCSVSALTGDGLDYLERKSREILAGASKGEAWGLAPNTRQARELEKAREELLIMKKDLEAGQSYDACLTGLDTANAILDRIIGIASHDELLDQIFSQFCIGK